MALGKEYNSALLAVERNNHGQACWRIFGTWIIRENVFCRRGRTGWLTSAESRPVMIDHLEAALVVAPRSFRSLRLLNECRTFVRYADGRPGAAPGTHDDCVMAMAIAWAVRQERRLAESEDSGGRRHAGGEDMSIECGGRVTG